MIPPPLPVNTQISPPRRWLVITIICWMVILSFVSLMFVKQARAARIAAAAAQTSTDENLAMEITGRITVAQGRMSTDTSADGLEAQQKLTKQLLANVAKLATSPVDELKQIVVIRELQGSANAIAELKSKSADFAKDHSTAVDAAHLTTAYTDGPGSLSDADRVSLIAHLGWFGQLAASQGKPDDSPDRMVALRTAKESFYTLMVFGVAILGLFGVGFILLVLFIIWFSLGRIQFAFRKQPPIGAPIFLETFALWGMSFILISSVLRPIKSAASPVVFESIFAVMSALVALWPMARGVSWAELRQSLGWHAGDGVVKEIGAGIAGYIAGLPILGLGVLMTLFLSSIGHAHPTHPIQQEFTGHLSGTKILGLLITISVLAPFLEETMFRGALYFHLRRRWRPWLSAGIVALLFAAIHPQGWSAIPLLGSIAIVLALLREWRGSLIASMTGHAINNGIVLLVLVMSLH